MCVCRVQNSGPQRPAAPRPAAGLVQGFCTQIHRSWLSQKSLSKRHVFSAIYLLFNSKVPKKAGLVVFLFHQPEERCAAAAARRADPALAGLRSQCLNASQHTEGQGLPKAARAPPLREWLSQKSLSKRHVFSAIYLLFNRKWVKKAGLRASEASA